MLEGLQETPTEPISAADVAEVLGTAVVAVLGDRERTVARVAPHRPGAAGRGFVLLGERCRRGPAGCRQPCCGRRLRRSGRIPRAQLGADAHPPRRAARRFHPGRPDALRAGEAHGIHPTAVVDPEADIGSGVHIGPYAVIERAAIGDEAVIHAHVQVGPGTRIGRRVTVHSGTVIGADGFGCHRTRDGSLEAFPYVGSVVSEDDVEIGSNTSIDRGVLGETIIRRGAKIGNLGHIAQNVVVGEDAAVVAYAMIGGSTVIGARAYIAPNATVCDVLTIRANSLVGLGALVVEDVAPGVRVMGASARPVEEQHEFQARLRRLGEGSDS